MTGFDDYVAHLLETWNAPGLGVGIVEAAAHPSRARAMGAGQWIGFGGGRDEEP